MQKFVSFILELLRLSILLGLTLLLLGGMERIIYEVIKGKAIFHWSMTVGNIIIFFILYRNYFQFKGWYKSQKQETK